MTERNGIALWKVSVSCWVTFSSIQCGAKSWLIMNLWQFSHGKLPHLHSGIGRIEIMMWQCVKVICLTLLCAFLFWVTLAVLWTHEYQASNFMACSVVCSVACTPVGSQSHCFWDMNVAFVFLLCKLQQGQFSQEKPGSGTGHLEQFFQNLIVKGLEQPKVTLSYLCCVVTSRVSSSLYLSLT